MYFMILFDVVLSTFLLFFRGLCLDFVGAIRAVCFFWEWRKRLVLRWSTSPWQMQIRTLPLEGIAVYIL